MYPCPHCAVASISAFRKLGASETFPAVCPQCGGLSFVSAWAHAASTVVMEVLLWGSIIAALVLKSWYALLIFPAGLVLWSLAIGHTFSLRPIERVGVRAARRKAIVHVAGAALVIGILIYFFAER
jgi:hypothetical protein